MPMYEYRCPDCGGKFEMLRRMSDADSELVCPSCESHKVERQFSCFATSGACNAPAGSGFR